MCFEMLIILIVVLTQWEPPSSSAQERIGRSTDLLMVIVATVPPFTITYQLYVLTSGVRHPSLVSTLEEQCPSVYDEPRRVICSVGGTNEVFEQMSSSIVPCRPVSLLYFSAT